MDRGAISRRDFLRMAGIAGAAVGAGAGMGGLLSACGGEETTTTTAGATTTSATATTTTAAPTTTSAGVEGGRDVKVGLVSPVTGFLAPFSPPVKWSIERWSEALEDGVMAGDGKNHKVVFELRDTQSDSNRAAQVTGDLINNDKVDVVISSGSPDTVNPSADQCEALGVPSVSTFVPWQAFFFGRGGAPDKPFKWTYAFTGGLEAIVGTYIDMWDKLSTNKKLGGVWPNNSDGISWTDPNTGAPPIFAAAGYELVLPGLYPPGSEDFTAQITEFKKQGCEICVGAMPTPDFVNFWSQASQQGYKPKAMTVGLALLFPEAARAVGDLVIGCTSELVWHPSYPYTSSLSGETCQQLADDYEERTGNQWSPAVGQYMAMEWIVDALKRTADLNDREALLQAIATTKMDTMWGPMDFTAPVQMGTNHPVLNVMTNPSTGGQWRTGTGKWPYDVIPVSNKFGLDVPLNAEIQPLG